MFASGAVDFATSLRFSHPLQVLKFIRGSTVEASLVGTALDKWRVDSGFYDTETLSVVVTKKATAGGYELWATQKESLANMAEIDPTSTDFWDTL